MRLFLLICLAMVAAVACFLVGRMAATPPPPPPAPVSGVASTYYVDAMQGDDGRDGRSEGTAWKSLGRLLRAPLLPGSSVLLRRGGVWRESLNLTSSGDSDAPITVGAYGDGEAPSVRGSDSFSSPGNWRYESEGLWHVDDIRNDPGMLIRDGQPAVQRLAKGELADPWDFWYDGQARRLYVRLDSNPAAMAALIEVPVREFVAGPLGASHVRLAGLDLRHPRVTTLLLWEADHVEIEDCAFTQSPGTHVQIGQGSNYTRVTGSRFDDWNIGRGRSYAIQAMEAGSGPADIEDCTFTATHRSTGEDHTAIRSDDKAWIRSVRGCRFLGHGGALAGDGIAVWQPNAAASTIAIEDNLFQELGGSAIALEGLDNYGGALSVSVQRNWISEVCRGDYLDRDAIRARAFPSGKVTLLLACNVVMGTVPGQQKHGGIGIQEARGVRVIHNAIEGADDGITLGFGTVGAYVANNILLRNRAVGLRDEAVGSEYLHNACFENRDGPAAGLTLGENDVITNPLLDEQLRPQPGSPCIDRGVEAGLAADYDRKPVPSGLAPDIGPYELAPPLP